MIRDIPVSIQKEIRLLHRKKGRDDKQKFFVEGTRIVKEAIKENVEIDYVVITDLIEKTHLLVKLLEDRGVDIYVSTDKVMKELSDTDTPQGIIAVIPYLKNVDNPYDDVVLVLDSIQDPGNMGTILRTADAAGVSRVIMSKGSVDVYNPKVLRSTMGSIFRVPIERHSDLESTILELKREGYITLAMHLKGQKNYYDVNLRNKVVIVVGNEANGMKDNIANVCDELVKIPMRGRIESLNASVSASIMMYEVLRQKMKSI
ncbi:MAG: 23S rRNA (guanosine(2251)-2'-O)-methyltransferase RlmB [Clostridiales bacterium]|nr:23S rRNA (guanosine(2251)-2'-O)-methyltransferase RlmB [Clostridiales bacterium]